MQNSIAQAMSHTSFSSARSLNPLELEPSFLGNNNGLWQRPVDPYLASQRRPARQDLPSTSQTRVAAHVDASIHQSRSTRRRV